MAPSSTNEARLHEKTPAFVTKFLAEPYPLSSAQIEQYNLNGHIKLQQVLTGEVLDYYRGLIDLAVRDCFKGRRRQLSERSVYEQSFLQAFNLWRSYPAVSDFVHSTRFARVAQQLMAVDGVRLWFDQALYKEPGGRLTDYHQDAGFWPVHPPDKTVTFWIALNDAIRESGCMGFASGSHRIAGDTEFIDIFTTQQEIEPASKLQGVNWEWVPLAAGDCTFHSGKIFHCAGPNETTEMRAAMTMAYMAHDATYDWPASNPRADRHQFVTQDMQRGDPLAHTLTPRLI